MILLSYGIVWYSVHLQAQLCWSPLPCQDGRWHRHYQWYRESSFLFLIPFIFILVFHRLFLFLLFLFLFHFFLLPLPSPRHVHRDLLSRIDLATFPTQGAVSGTINWTPSIDDVGRTYYYQCSLHAPMTGTIEIKGIPFWLPLSYLL